MGDALGDVVELSIDALAAGGDGVGRTAEGRVVFVPRTAPGDRVRARISELHPRYARADLEELVAASPSRTVPPCEVFGTCGGCSWQHVDYAAQCEAKRRIAEDALVRVGRLALPGPVTLLPSPDPYAYRARARVAVEAGRVGYRLPNSRELCAVRTCPILSAPADARLRALVGAPPARNGEWEIAAGADGARAHEVGAAGPELELAVGGDRLRVSAGVFFQANPALHEALVASVTRAAGYGALALELHAGCGFFTLALARAFERVVAVEADAAAAADLRHNLARAGLAHVEVVAARVETALAGPLAALRPDAVVLDPPRTGLPRGAADRLCALAPARVAYLSCDPATLARDLAALVAGGFRLDAVEAFDLFPQTPHVEVLASLSLQAPRSGARSEPQASEVEEVDSVAAKTRASRPGCSPDLLIDWGRSPAAQPLPARTRSSPCRQPIVPARRTNGPNAARSFSTSRVRATAASCARGRSGCCPTARPTCSRTR